MARDLDFRRIPSRPSVPSAAKSPAKSTSRRAVWPIVLLIVGLGLSAAALFQVYNQNINSNGAPPDSTQLSPTASQPASASAEAPPSTNNTKNAFQAETTLVVQIYDSGAGSEAMEATIAKLTDSGFEVKNLGPSQFEYDKTYLWHRATFADQAKAIGQLLSEREVSYKETQLDGIFDLMIYLGKK